MGGSQIGGESQMGDDPRSSMWKRVESDDLKLVSVLEIVNIQTKLNIQRDSSIFTVVPLIIEKLYFFDSHFILNSLRVQRSPQSNPSSYASSRFYELFHTNIMSGLRF
jgi:hypothetical protein